MSKTLPGPKYQVSPQHQHSRKPLAQTAGALDRGGFQESVSRRQGWEVGHPQTNGEAPRPAPSLPSPNNSLLGGDWLVRRFLIGPQRRGGATGRGPRPSSLAPQLGDGGGTAEIPEDGEAQFNSQLCLHLLCDLRQAAYLL